MSLDVKREPWYGPGHPCQPQALRAGSLWLATVGAGDPSGIGARHDAEGSPRCEQQGHADEGAHSRRPRGLPALGERPLKAEGFDVVGEAPDGNRAIEAVARLRPGVVLLATQLPGVDGLSVAEQLAVGSDPPAVVLDPARPRSGRRASGSSSQGTRNAGAWSVGSRRVRSASPLGWEKS